MFEDRAAGAIMGALIGDALGLGCHWYYNLNELHRDFGPWIADYTTPKKDRYHAGMTAGQLSQTGIIFVMLLRSVVENKEYLENDFTRRLDEDLFPLLDGSPNNGPGGYTNQSIRNAYQQRIEQKKSWTEIHGNADTTEAAERCIVLASRYAKHPAKLAVTVSANCTLTQNDEMVVAMTTAYNCILSQLISGDSLTPSISNKLMDLVYSGTLPFHTIKALETPAKKNLNRPQAGQFSSPDALLTAGFAAQAAQDLGIHIEPASKVSTIYGMPCAIYHQLPAAYYLGARFKNDFESAVLHAINGGGQNMSRAMLTGALVGAQVGLTGIPKRFIDGLENSEELLQLAKNLAKLAANNQ